MPAFAGHDSGRGGARLSVLFAKKCERRGSPPSFRDGAQHQTSDAQLRIGESRDSGFDASHRPGMTWSHRYSPFAIRLSSHFNAPLPAAAPVANEACSKYPPVGASQSSISPAAKMPGKRRIMKSASSSSNAIPPAVEIARAIGAVPVSRTGTALIAPARSAGDSDDSDAPVAFAAS